MPVYAVIMIAWLAVQAVIQVVYIGRSIETTVGGTLFLMGVNTLMVWGIVSLAAS